MATPRLRVYFALGLLTAFLTWPALARQSGENAPLSAPDAVQQQKLLSAMERYADQYISNLPNFVCVQVTRQFEAGKQPNHWHKGDVLTSRLIFNDRHEDRTLQLVNEKPVTPGMSRWHTSLTTEGEFGILIGNVFGLRSNPAFTWRGWEVLRGKRLAVFDYSIDGAHSTLTLSLSDLAQAVVPYRGSVYADAATGGIWRITEAAFDIPPEVRTKSISTVIDYGEVPIGGVTYLLPLHATVLLDTGINNIRHEIEFNEYRKFEADSKITYATDANTNDAPSGNSRLSTPP